MTHEEYQKYHQSFFPSHQRQFREWVKKNDVKVYESAEEAGVNTPLKVGDKVTFTNDYGVVFEGHTVLGFRKADTFCPEHVVYIDYDCYWAPARLKNLKLERV